MRPTPGGGRVVVVTGASSGIGKATARELAARGDHLVLASRGGAALTAAAQECSDLGAEVLAVPTDVTDLAAVAALLERTLSRHGRVDGWVHAASVMAYGSVLELPVETFRHVVDTSILGVLHTAKTVLPVMRKQGHGVLVVVGSVLGRIATPSMGAYVTAKWAAEGLVRVLSLEQRDQPDVHVCTVTPGSVNTPIYEQAANVTGRTPWPPPPVVQPERVARAIVASLDRPRRDRSVGPATRMMSLGFRGLPPVYDAMVGPLLRITGLTKRPQPPTRGNLDRPRADLAAVAGPRARGGVAGVLGRPAGIQRDMATVSRLVHADPDDVWAVLADGWLYPTWVVGASRLRAVEGGWPAAGASIHHSVGLWPALIDDRTEVLVSEPENRLRLRARGWPLGEALVEITLEPREGGTLVTIAETPSAGPGLVVDNRVNHWLLARRNEESLFRLASVAEARGGGSRERERD
ncbi:MAG TPA: SDR family NAD(P)-dependent oxidoreductase [Jiangellales bacterium]|nr:SDR family NAD(P)-dependent oxidoreductase [Jiangellales bacterium]